MSDKRESGVVVRIMQLSTNSPCGFVHLSQRPANANNSPSFTSKQYGCFVLPFFLPLVECVCRNQATLRLEGFPERRSCGDCFGSRVDRLAPDTHVLGPGRQKSPSHR